MEREVILEKEILHSLEKTFQTQTIYTNKKCFSDTFENKLNNQVSYHVVTEFLINNTGP